MAQAGFVVGRVVSEQRGAYRVYTQWGEQDAEVTGHFRHEVEDALGFPVVGDWVVVERQGAAGDRKSTRLNSSHSQQSRMPSSA